jgi:hypothetical protein
MNNTEGYFISESEDDLGQCLVLTAPWHNEFAELMLSQGITVLRLSSSAGWKEHDISFVANLDFLTGIEVYSWNVKDVSPIFQNTGLRYVGIQCDISYIADFKTLKNLEICKLTWRPKVIGLETCVKLRHLNISDYPNEDLINLASLIRLERLQISSSKLISLNGIESMSLLKVFDAAICRKLTDISSLAACTALEVMEFHSCKQFSELPKNICTDNLREVTLVDCGKVKSLSPLVNCKNLRKLRFIGDTSILDGNLDFLLKHPSIRDVWYAKKSHYSVSRENLKVHLELNSL